MKLILRSTAFLLATAISIAGALGASPVKKLSRANDLSGVLADMDDGNRVNRKSIPIESAMKDEGIELVIHRLTLGRRLFKTVNGQQVDDADASYTERARQASTAQMRFGAYHVLFASPTGEDNGIEQARGFLSAIKDRCVPGQRLILAVDWEPTRCGGRPCGLPEPKYIASFIPAVRRVTGKPVLVYTSPVVLATFSNEIAPGSQIGDMLKENPLWLASYYRAFRFSRGADTEKVRTGFVFPLVEQHQPWDQWRFWQYAASEDTEGPAPHKSVSLTVRDHRLDLSWFAGGREEFRNFYDQHATSCDMIDLSKL
jgi:GH25 family lysozyme M1 (1,4-beta-N-acetylmuramidase)